MDQELIGGDPLHRLQWGDSAGWTAEIQAKSGEWLDVGTYAAAPSNAARPFTRWLASQTGLTFDLAEDAVLWLRDQTPSRLIDPIDEVELGPAPGGQGYPAGSMYSFEFAREIRLKLGDPSRHS